MDALLKDLDEAAAIVDRGGLVVIPTETVYGLATRPSNVGRIFELKGRSEARAVQLLVPDGSWLWRVGEASAQGLALADAFWPGPLTLVVPAREAAPAPLVFQGAIGVRVPAHPIALDLLARCGPLAASSANRTGEPTPALVSEIHAIFEDRVDGYLDGGRIDGSSSTVVDLTQPTPRVLREGPIPMGEMERVTGGRLERA